MMNLYSKNIARIWKGALALVTLFLPPVALAVEGGRDEMPPYVDYYGDTEFGGGINCSQLDSIPPSALRSLLTDSTHADWDAFCVVKSRDDCQDLTELVIEFGVLELDESERYCQFFPYSFNDDEDYGSGAGVEEGSPVPDFFIY